LTFAEGAVPTVKGLIVTHWEKSPGGRFSLSIRVPANTRASIYIPKLEKGDFTIAESGKLLWPERLEINDPGLLAVADEGSFIKCFVGAGSYNFSEKPLNPGN